MQRKHHRSHAASASWLRSRPEVPYEKEKVLYEKAEVLYEKAEVLYEKAEKR